MPNLLSKIKFILRKPKVIIVVGEGKGGAKEAISEVLKDHFSINKDVLILENNLSESAEFDFLIKNSSLPILVATHVGEIPPDKDFFAGEKEDAASVRKLAKRIPSRGYLILNFDDETVREIQDENDVPSLTFGFQERADLRVSDINMDGGMNFKINYKGNIVPVWLERLFGKEQIYNTLAAVAVGVVLNLNLVEISQSLRGYKGLPGKMRMIDGIKNSRILDDSENATVFSMLEAIQILGKIEGKRKVAVLGDILGIGKYTIEVHESVGERVAENADLLFTFGPRAKFVAEGAKNKGIPEDKIFSFDTIKDGKMKLQDEIKEGDIILVDGSEEMKMGELVEEIMKV